MFPPHRPKRQDLTFSRAINSTGKINQNIRSSGLGSGWQETSQVGLFNGYQNALNTNSSDYNTAVKELNIAISQAKTSGDIATMQAIQTYAIQLAQQLYQEARDAVADRQWELSYALQKAAFDLEHAAQTGSNSNYYGSNSYSYPTNTKTESTETVSEEDSKVNAAWADYELENVLRSGYVGTDVLHYIKGIFAEYIDKMNNKDTQALMDKYGLTEEDL